MMFEQETIPLDAVRINGGTQSRVELNQQTISEYSEFIRQGGDLPRVVVFFDGASFWLADGFHRFHAHRDAGAMEIAADIYTGTQRDAILHSVGANASHGLRRTNEDKRRAVLTLLNDPEWSAWSDEEIAKRCGVGRAYVVTVRKDCILSPDDKISIEPVNRTVTRNGKTYQMNVAGIGKTNSKQRPLTEQEESLCSLVRGECVYLLATNDRVKVGWTRHGARRRVNDLLTTTPSATVIAVAEGGNVDERRVHKILECDRDAGEWFVCSVDIAIFAMVEAGLSPLTAANIGKVKPAAVPVPEADDAEPIDKPAPAAPLAKSFSVQSMATSDEVHALREQLAEIAEHMKSTLSDNEMMGRVFDADDRIAASMAEAKRQKAIAENAERTLAAKNGEFIERARAVQHWMGRAQKAEKELARLTKEAA